jgi:branched-chain amino acid transport system substrate-binding protein
MALYEAGPFLDAKFIGQAGGNKLGFMYCAEDAACTTAYQRASAVAPKAGLQPVYAQQVSLAQPSYTAECLNARSKGVNILQIAVDANSVERIGRDCAGQGFRPLYASGSLIVTSALAQDPQLDGLVASEPTFPWTFSGSPAAQEYQQSIAALAPNLATSSTTSAAWVSGKLLQAALAHVSPASPVTSQDVINGLYALHNETLGGLAPPLNFVANQPAPVARCYFGTQIVHGQWTPLNAGLAYC